VSDFTDALERGDLAALRRVPKGDIHNHGPLSGCREFLRERTGRDIAPLTAPIASMSEMGAWITANVRDILFQPGGRLLGYEAAFALAKRDGVTRIAFGDDVWLADDGFDPADLYGGLRALRESAAPEVEWIAQVGVNRMCAPDDVLRWMEPFLALGVYRAIDMSGDEMVRPIEEFVPVYRAAKAAGLRLRAHVGEWGTADDVVRAVEVLELDEVQHGIAAAESPAAMRFLADNNIQLNVCPTSNVLLGRVESIAAHPVRKLVDAGVRVTINTDDALVFGCTVSEEFLALYQAGVLSAAELDQIRLNSLTDTAKA
jgi:hypothetical protein